MNVYDKIVAGVAENSTIVASAMLLLKNIAEQIRTTAGNSDASLQLADLVSREAPRFSDHIMAGTPMILATPQYHPAPTGGAGGADSLAVTSMTGTPEEVATWLSANEGLREIDRDEHDDGTVTAYFRPVKDAPKEEPPAPGA